MKSLNQYLTESLADPIEWDAKQIKDVKNALKPLFTWKAQEDKYEINHHTANQIANKMIKDLENAGCVNYRDFKAEKNYLTHAASLIKGNGLVVFHSNRNMIDSLCVYLITDRQYRYIVRFTPEGIKASAYRDYDKKAVIADAGSDWIFEIPAEVAKDIFNNSNLKP